MLIDTRKVQVSSEKRRRKKKTIFFFIKRKEDLFQNGRNGTGSLMIFLHISSRFV